MNCWHCKTPLRWGADHDVQDDSGKPFILSELSCPNCKSFVEVYYPVDTSDEDDPDEVY